MPSSTLRLLGVCFFLSGGAGLVYEIVWSRHLQLLFGSTTEAVSVVLAVFMTGLGLGAHVLGRVVDRSPSPLRLYGLLEIGVGVYALLTDPLLALTRTAFFALARHTDLSPASATAAKTILSAAVLLLPAFLMGGTLPALVRAVSESAARAQRLVALFYAFNTLGAVAGTAATGFVFLEILGMTQTMRLSAAVSIGVGLVAVLRARQEAAAAPPDAATVRLWDAISTIARAPGGRYALVGLFVSGATTMLYEVVFVRTLGLVFGVSSYAFTIVLAVFLVGLGLGAVACGLMAGVRPPRVLDFAVVQLGVALSAAAGFALIPWAPRAVAYFRQVPGLGFWEVLGAKGVVAVLVLFPLALVCGLSVPLLIGAVAQDLKSLGRVIGSAYMVNTAGTVVGSLATGFALITLLGTERSLRAGALLNLVVGLWGLFAVGLITRWRPRILATLVLGVPAALLAIVPGPWPAWTYIGVDTAGSYVFTSRADLESSLTVSGHEIRFFREGRNATVAVAQTPKGRVLLVGGHPDASDLLDMETQILLGLLPVAVHPHPADVLVVGFGSGVTVDSVARVPDVARIDCVELERSVVEASPLFRHVNHAVERSPKVRFSFNDARSFVGATSHEYDVIVSQPSNPWRAGVASLFTTDFFQSARRVMKKGAIFGQWFQLYNIDFDSFRLALRSLAHVFPEQQIWWLSRTDVLILASDEPIRLPRARIDDLLTGEFRADRVGAARIGRPDELYARLLLTTAGVKELLKGEGPLHTDDLPLLEFEAPRGVFDGDDLNPARVLAAKVRNGVGPLPVDGEPVPGFEQWLGLSGLYRSASLMAESREALRRAEQSGAPPGVTRVRASELALESRDTAGARRLLEEAIQLGGPGAVDPATEPGRRGALISARVAILERRLADAARTLDGVAAADGPGALPPAESVDLFEGLVDAGETAAAFTAGARILESARIGTRIGAAAVGRVQFRLPNLAPKVPPAELRALLERAPRATDGFPEISRVLTQARLFEIERRPQDVIRLCERLESLGLVQTGALTLHARALDAVGRHGDADRRRERARLLSPQSVRVPVDSGLFVRRPEAGVAPDAPPGAR